MKNDNNVLTKEQISDIRVQLAIFYDISEATKGLIECGDVIYDGMIKSVKCSRRKGVRKSAKIPTILGALQYEEGPGWIKPFPY